MPCAAWILWSAACVFLGWTLSWAGLLGGSGYAVGFALLGAAAGLLLRQGRGVRLPVRWRRFRRPLPGLFALLALLAVAGGLLNHPTNYDALCYRIPRLFHWLSEGGWHWVETFNLRMNIATAGADWLFFPFFLTTGSDRLFFLPSLISFLLLPGLVFSVLQGLGVARRVAWLAMWLIPGAFCFVFQAGGVGNDLIGAVYLLAALHFALKARRTRSAGSAWLSLLAVALCTGVKVTNLPMVLPWAVVFLPCVPLLFSRALASAGAVVAAGVVSFVPTAFLNHLHAGHWGGDPEDSYQVRVRQPVAGVLGNGIQLAAQACETPVQPWAGRLTAFFNEGLPSGVREFVVAGFPRFKPCVGEMPQEENSGLGAAVSLVCVGLLLVFPQALFARVRRLSWRGVFSHPGFQVGGAAWIAFLCYAATLGSESAPRLLAPYYVPVLIPFLLPWTGWGCFGGRRGILLAVLLPLSAVPGLLLSPSRPIVPMGWISAELSRRFPESAFLRRTALVYEVYSHRHDALAPLRKHLKDSDAVVGAVLGIDASDLALWRPWGSRRVVHLLEHDLASPSFRARRIPVVVVLLAPGSGLADDPSLAALKASLVLSGGELVALERFPIKASEGDRSWAVARFPVPP